MSENEVMNKYLGEEGLQKLIDLTKAYDAASLTLSQEYTNTEIAKIKSGDVVVKEAEKADYAVSAGTASNADRADEADYATEAGSAISATKATQDASGNIITETYETKTDAITKLEEAKEYADTKADENHVHDLATAATAGFMSSADKAKLDGIDMSNFTVSLLVDEDENAVLTSGNIPSVEGVEF